MARRRPSTAWSTCSLPTSSRTCAPCCRPRCAAWCRSSCCSAPTSRGGSRRSRSWSTRRPRPTSSARASSISSRTPCRPAARSAAKRPTRRPSTRQSSRNSRTPADATRAASRRGCRLRRMHGSLFVTTALPYANGPFHIGHIMEYIQADIWVRFQRMQGRAVHFVCADDAHGAPIMLKAESEGVTPQQLVARIAAGRPRYLKGFHLSFDHWYTTDSPENTELSQDIYLRLKAAGLIYAEPVEQFYDPVKRMFLPDRYIKGECPNCHAKDQYADACEVCSIVNTPMQLINPYSTLTGAQPVLKTSEHLFFRLSDQKCVEFLQSWLGGAGRLQPQVANKAREWLTGKGEQTLADWDISRDAPYFGIPIPDAPGKYFYVWLDAPIGYLAALKSY